MRNDVGSFVMSYVHNKIFACFCLNSMALGYLYMSKYLPYQIMLDVR